MRTIAKIAIAVGFLSAIVGTATTVIRVIMATRHCTMQAGNAPAAGQSRDAEVIAEVIAESSQENVLQMKRAALISALLWRLRQPRWRWRPLSADRSAPLLP